MTIDEEINAAKAYIRKLEQEIADCNRDISVERRKIRDLRAEQFGPPRADLSTGSS